VWHAKAAYLDLFKARAHVYYKMKCYGSFFARLFHLVYLLYIQIDMLFIVDSMRPTDCFPFPSIARIESTIKKPASNRNFIGKKANQRNTGKKTPNY
jgi:hypothetical protein